MKEGRKGKEFQAQSQTAKFYSIFKDDLQPVFEIEREGALPHPSKKVPLFKYQNHFEIQ